MSFIIVSRKGNQFEYTPVDLSSFSATPTPADAATALKQATDQLVQQGQVIVNVIKL